MKQLKISPKLFPIVFSLFTFLFLIGYYIFAWTEPTSPPPGGNVLAPINTGSINQGKLGSLGIGISSPLSRLHIKDGQSWGSDLSIDATGLAGGRRYLLISTGGNTSEGQGKVLIKDNNANAVRLTIDNSGNVGIGTINPAQKLDIIGNLTLNSNEIIQMRLENSSYHPVICNSSNIGYIYYKTSFPEGVCVCRGDGWSCSSQPPTSPGDKIVFVTKGTFKGA